MYDPSRPSEIAVKAPVPNTPVQQGFQGGMAQQSGFQNNQGGWGRGMHYGKWQDVIPETNRLT